MARCKAFEIKGPDASRTAGAERCVRDAVTTSKVDGKSYPICTRHDGAHWSLFRSDGWLYAIDLDAQPVPETVKRKKQRK